MAIQHKRRDFLTYAAMPLILPSRVFGAGAPSNKITAVLVEKLKLPKNGPDGMPLSYKFHHKNSGKQIQEDQSLADVGVQSGYVLRLQPEITAG